MPNNRLFDKSSERRNEILDAAGKLFSRQGFHATSMRDLAKSVNLQGGSLYAHIESKEALLFELVNRAADGFISAAKAVPSHLPPQKRLEGLVQGHLRVIVQELPNATVFFHEWKFLGQEMQQAITALRDEYENYFYQTIKAGVEAGDFRVEDARLATRFVLSSLNWTYHWYRPGGTLSLQALTQSYFGLILGALGEVP